MEKIDKNEQKALWLQFKAGNKEAFDTIVKLYYRMLFGYGLRLVGNKLLVQDCLQDFFVDLWDKRENLGDVEVLNAYLIASFRRRLLREKDKIARLSTSSAPIEDFNFHADYTIEEDIIDKEITHENLHKLKHHLTTLTKRQQEAIHLRFFKELEYPEIAEIMDINHHSAINLVYGAVKLIRKNWTFMELLLLILFF